MLLTNATHTIVRSTRHDESSEMAPESFTEATRETRHEFLHFQGSDRPSLDAGAIRISRRSPVGTPALAEEVAIKSSRGFNRRHICGAAAAIVAARPFSLSGFLFSQGAQL
jgi:hypothetical protein